VVACGDSSSSSTKSVPSTAGIAPSEDGGPKALSDLADSEKKKLCDWTAAEGGGYGAKKVCEGGIIQGFASQAACLCVLPTCSTASVVDWEACRLAEVKDLCATIDTVPDECAPIIGCGGGGGDGGACDGGGGG
jgi:hypothetical protein